MSRLVKRPAIIGRLFYHTAMCLLAQIHPVEPRDSEDNRVSQLLHAHHVCGIVAHTKDKGVASVAIRALAIAGGVLTNHQEQVEVLEILERISRETGWRLGRVIGELKDIWCWEGAPSRTLAPINSRRNGSFPGGGGPGPGPPPNFFSPSSQQQQSPALTTAATPPAIVSAPTSTRPMVNPLLANADFKQENHPYQNWYEPPSRTSSLSSSQQGGWP